MNCISCATLLDDNISGFVVCPKCQTVNIAHGDPAQSLASVSTHPTTPVPAAIANPAAPRFTDNQRIRHIPKKIIPLVSGTTVLLIVILCFSLFLGHQNAKAATLLKSADANISIGKYTTAASLLTQGLKLHASSENHNKIAQTSSQNKLWIEDTNYLQQADAMVQQQKFSQAAMLITRISRTFPTYSAVLSLQKLIVNDQNTIATTQKANAAKAAAQQVAQAAAQKAAATASTSPSTSSSSKPISSTTSSVVAAAAPVTVPVYTSGGYNYYYAGARQFVTASGVSVNFTQEDPQVNQTAGSANHSLMELSVEPTSGSNTVEVGWIVDQGQFGDASPHLFVYHFVNGQTTCYDGCGFVQVSSTNTPGEVVSSGANASFEVNYSSGNWNIYYNGSELGYFPGSLWSNSFTQAGFIQLFGEVATTGGTKCIQMGNGIAGNAAGAARFSDFNLINASSPPALSPYQTASSNYSYGNATSTGLTIGGPGSC